MIATYRPSGNVGFLTAPLFVGACIVSVGLAYAYHLSLDWIPYIYLNGMTTLLVGAALALVLKFVIKAGKIRNQIAGVALALGLVVATVSAKYWFQYQSLLNVAVNEIMMEENVPEDERGEVRKFVSENGFSFVEHIKFRIDKGWQLSKGVAENKNAPAANGIFVLLVWATEAGMLIFCACLGAMLAVGLPFNEKLRLWASENETVMELPITSPEMVSRIKHAQTIDELLDIPIPDSDCSNQFATYQVSSIPGQELEDAFLSVDLVSIVTGRDGQTARQSKSLIKYAVLPQDKRMQLKEAGSLLGEALVEYRKSRSAETSMPTVG